MGFCKCMHRQLGKEGKRGKEGESGRKRLILGKYELEVIST